MNKLTAIGITSGVGSMIVGAKQLGFKVLGNVEWRKYYHHKDAQGRNTFEMYFKGAKMYTDYNRPPEHLRNADIAFIHTECGGFSSLNAANNNKLNDPTDIPKAMKLIAELQPKFFLSDNLPKSLIAFPIHEYARLLPEYDIFPEWISNANYGNVQKNRRRCFMVGAHKSLGFAFRPGEFNFTGTVSELLGDLQGQEGKIPNHDKHTLQGTCAAARSMDGSPHALWTEIAETFRTAKPGYIWRYKAADGLIKVKMGMSAVRWEAHSPVLTGTNPAHNPNTGLPLSIRERARIQGFPDDFVFYGTKFEPDGTWNHYRNITMVKQTGKAMPIQFCRYVADQAKHHLKGKKFKTTDWRSLKPDPYVDRAKTWYCDQIGYANQKGACSACWLKKTCTLPRKVV